MDTEVPCGVSYSTSMTKMGKFPWIVGIVVESSGKFICSGSIISPRYIMTAGHCIDKEELRDEKECQKSPLPKNCTLTLMDIEIAILFNTKTPHLRLRDAVRIIPHPEMKIHSGENDIALIELKTPLNCSDVAIPVCLPKKKVVKVGDSLVHGKLTRMVRRRSEVPAGFSWFKTEVVEENKCYHEDAKSESILCVLNKSGSQKSCMADSGATLLKKIGRKHYAVGIMSMGAQDCPRKKPDIYTDVVSYLPWINKYLRSDRADEFENPEENLFLDEFENPEEISYTSPLENPFRDEYGDPTKY